MPRILVIGYVWPEPQSSAAGKRMMQLLEFFLQRGYEIVFSSTAAPSPFQVDLTALGITTEQITLNSSSFDSFLEDCQPSIVLYDRFMMEEQFGWRVRKQLPDALQILDTEDLHFLRKARAAAVAAGVAPDQAQLQTDLAKREIASMYRSDLSLIISPLEMQLLQEEFQIPRQLLYYLPIIRQDPTVEQSKISFEQRQDFVFIGNFRHDPNWDAVLELKTKIWPLIRKSLPQARLNIYGAYTSQKVHQLHNPKDGFLVHGRAESARVVIESARLMLAPLRFGAGIKGKFLDAMANGTPSLTTSIGSEGMTGTVDWPGQIEDDAAAIARAAIDLYSNPKKWKEAQKRGYEKLLKDFPGSQAGDLFVDHMEFLLKDLKGHRQSNFVGQLLQHHQHQSTRFLSLYIEEKNKSRLLRGAT